MVRPMWKLEVKKACFCSLGDFKSYNNLWEGENKEIPIQSFMTGRSIGGSQPGESGS
jgi:hypothetical protein